MFERAKTWTGGSLKIQITARRWFRHAQNEVTKTFVRTHQTPPLVTQSSAKCGYQMRSQKPEDIWFRTSKRALVGVVTITGPEALPAETGAFCHCVPLLLLPLHQPAQNRRTGGDAHLDQCMNGARMFIIGSCYQSLSRSYAYLFNSPPLIIRSGVLMNELLQLVSNWW